MAGTDNFADGKISVRVTLAMPTAFRPGKEGERRTGGPRSGHRGGGPRSGGMGAGGPPGGMGGGEEPSDQGPGDDSPRRPALGSTLPAAQLKIHLQNTASTTAISCEVVDFNSALGNFAVFPSRFQIAAGQSASSETMTSRLGVEGAEIPVTVALRVNDHVEKKVITLRLIPTESDKSAPSPGK